MTRFAVASASLLLAAFGVVAPAPEAEGAETTQELIDMIDACVGRVGSPADHADLCMGLHIQPCAELPGGETTVGMVDCIVFETLAWDTILNREYKALTGKLDEEQRAALRDAQRKWIAFRDADCAFPQVFIRGSLARPWGADCVMQHTARRALELRSFLDFLEY